MDLQILVPSREHEICMKDDLNASPEFSTGQERAITHSSDSSHTHIRRAACDVAQAVHGNPARLAFRQLGV
jgi:hypothetical protein